MESETLKVFISGFDKGFLVGFALGLFFAFLVCLVIKSNSSR